MGSACIGFLVTFQRSYADQNVCQDLCSRPSGVDDHKSTNCKCVPAAARAFCIVCDRALEGWPARAQALAHRAVHHLDHLQAARPRLSKTSSSCSGIRFSATRSRAR